MPSRNTEPSSAVMQALSGLIFPSLMREGRELSTLRAEVLLSAGEEVADAVQTLVERSRAHPLTVWHAARIALFSGGADHRRVLCEQLGLSAKDRTLMMYVPINRMAELLLSLANEGRSESGDLR
jgi:hypothetical protein